MLKLYGLTDKGLKISAPLLSLALILLPLNQAHAIEVSAPQWPDEFEALITYDPYARDLYNKIQAGEDRLVSSAPTFASPVVAGVLSSVQTLILEPLHAGASVDVRGTLTTVLGTALGDWGKQVAEWAFDVQDFTTYVEQNGSWLEHDGFSWGYKLTTSARWELQRYELGAK